MTPDPKWTEGPWSVGIVEMVTGYPGFVLFGLSGDEKRDRTTLEAVRCKMEAAPDLYRAVAGYLAEMDNPSPCVIMRRNWRDKMRAALAKANGEEGA